MKRHFNKDLFKRSVLYNVKTLYRKSIEEATPQQVFQAAAYAIKDQIVDEWMDTQKEYDKQDPKIVYYMSMEFLMGRALGNNMINLQAYDEVKEARKKEMFGRFGIDRFAEVKVANLSTGMKQKVSLVISLVHNPEIIIFDEPTNGLDVLTARTVTDYLQELRAEGKTIILSTHIFSLVERLCDRVGIIIDGRMTACGTIDEVCNGLSIEDRFFEIYKEQKGGEE